MNQRVAKIKSHLKENKKVYIAATVGVVVGAVSVFIITRHGNVIQTTSSRGNNVNIKNVLAKNVTVVTTYLEDRTNYAIPVRCIETGEVFGSQNRAATLLGLNPGDLSSHLNGKYDHVKGLHFERVNEAVENVHKVV